MQTDVAVIGAGPVGMAAAALLHRAGVAVRVFEARSDRLGQSRATTIHPRTLEVLDALPTADGGSLAELMVAAGTAVPAAHFAVLPDRLSYERLDTSFPFVLQLSQVETERLLAEHLEANGVVVETGWELADLEQDNEGVTITSTAGAQERARYVIGADGAHSAVRHALDIGFPGTSATSMGFLADVRLDRPPAHPHHWDVERGSYSVIALPGGRYRVFGHEPSDTGLTPEEAKARQADIPDETELRATLHRMAGDDFGLREVIWTSRAGDATRHAEHYRVGRVFLAGDAAHVHLPAGGQGLNVGVQDAANLAWKLAAEVAGRAPRRIIDGPQSYDAERRPIAARLAANTLAQASLMVTFTPAGQALRDLVSRLIARDGDTADELRGWLSGLEVAYDVSAGSPVGRRVPNLPLAGGGTLHRALRPDRLTLVAFGPTPMPDELPVELVRSLRGWEDAAAVLVRPDGHAAAVWRADELSASAVAEVVAGWTVVGEPATR
ncbi:FAD-dependent monooxygenase [Kutzneria sp. CA-103260]|uniref:FAD-dependent monooxygenase n=1 Tax=Kutzneria sp. CA-103260 TaxID=2802641 RepID=UPI001BA8E58A|nr:FAD-dependent monooxygenase [Kutzneria sp. CA-103260]QUQ64678.1 FAD-dependent oxidoreductase [Kutzneria sp. CA-103260]